MSQNNPAQSGRARALAYRKAQLAGTTAKPATAPAPAAAPVPVVAKASAPSRPRVAVVATPVATSAGRAAAKQKRQAQIKGQARGGVPKAASPTRAPRKKPVEPIIEPRQQSGVASDASIAPIAPSKTDRKKTVKTEAVAQSGGRLQSKAYRQAQAKGKVSQDAYKNRGSNSGAKAKLANPDASSREIARQIRTERCTKGQSCAPTVSATKMRQDRLKQQGADAAPSKVQLSETLSGQVVSGVHVGQGNNRLTGAETGACQLVSGNEYLGAEEFATQCGSTPTASPAKVTQTQTTRGMSISGTEVGQAKQMTGNKAGACTTITGTEYIPADQAETFCGASPSASVAQQAFSVMSPANRSANADKVTGGDSYRSQSTTIKSRVATAPKKVMSAMTAKGNSTTGTQVGRLQDVTGSEKGVCHSVTGTGYQSVEESEAYCGTAPVETANKVTASGTSKGQIITGERSGNAGGMTGAEHGQCQAVTGTPYMGAENAVACSTEQQTRISNRIPAGVNPSISGVQPGPLGLTGAQKGACELVTGTHYQGTDQTAMVCGTANTGNAAIPGQSDFPQAMSQANVTNFAPAMNAETAGEPAIRISGDAWDRGDKVTGTEGPWASSRNASVRGASVQTPMGAQMFKNASSEVPMSPITGSSGNTDTGAKVTLSGGARA